MGVTVMVMDLVVTDTVVMVLGLEVLGTEVMLILFILKAMLNNHPIKLRRKLMPTLSKRMLNPNRRTHSLNRRMYLKHIARLKRMHLNKRMYNPNKHMLNQQLHTQRLRSLHIKIKRTASNLKSDIRNNLFTKRVDIFKNPFKDITMQQTLLVEIKSTFYQ